MCIYYKYSKTKPTWIKQLERVASPFVLYNFLSIINNVSNTPFLHIAIFHAYSFETTNLH